MKIIKTDFIAGAKQAEGVVVIIDVFRAFSVACYCLDAKPKCIIPVGDVDEAWSLKEMFPDAFMIGERAGKKLPGFDFGNSPKEVMGINFKDKVIIHTTHAGTQGLVNATKAQEILTGSFVNASATAQYILAQKPELVTLVRMGWKGEEASDEDTLCADYLESLLLGQPLDVESIKSRLTASPCADRFFDPNQPWNPREDFDLCLDVDKFDFSVSVVKDSKGFLKLCQSELNR